MPAKIVTYVLMISKVFPAHHPKRGEQTFFMSKILMNFDLVVVQDGDHQFASKPGYVSKYASAMVKDMGFMPKLHTIRENYDLWARRAEKINRGEAVLSIRQWTGSPYNYKRDGSKQVEIMRLDKIGVQRFGYERHVPSAFIDGGCASNLEFHFHKEVAIIAKNDGLSLEDFFGWFPKSVTDCALIHFTDMRYG